MNRIEHVIAATDLSDRSLDAVGRARRVAAEAGARLTVVHAMGIDALAPMRAFLAGSFEAVKRDVEEEARARIEGALAGGGPGAEVRLLPGTGADAIEEWTREAGAQLLVLGARGAGFPHGLALGTTTSRLLRTSSVPLLVVKEPAAGPYARVLVAVDLSAASLGALRLARAVAPHASVALLHAFDVPYEGRMRHAGVGDDVIQRYRTEAHGRAEAELEALATQAGVADYLGIVVRGDPARQVCAHAGKMASDLVVVGKHRVGALHEMILGSVTRHVLTECGCDTLVARYP